MVTEIVQQYRETHAECCQLLDAAFRLSVSTQGREDVTRGLEVGSWLFAKLYSHAKAAVDLAPNGPLGGVVTAQELWDISSIAVLVRAEVDAYYTFFYVALDEVDTEMCDFRWLLWDQHCERRRLKKLQLIGSTSPVVSDIEKAVNDLTPKVKAHPIYLRQKSSVQKKLRKGDLAIFATNSDLSERAHIDPAYYKTVFMFLSSYVHAHPFCMNQLAMFRAGKEESLRVISTVLRYASVYLSLALRDFLSLVPDQKATFPSGVEQLIDLWCGVASEFSKLRHGEVGGHA